MCLYSVDGPEPKIAERDIYCYKVIKVKTGEDGSKTYYPMRYPEFSKAYAVVYPRNSLRGIEARAEGEHTWNKMERILYRTLKSEYYEEDRLYRFESGWVHGFTCLADAESTARQLLLCSGLYSENPLKKEGMSLEIWKCVVRKGSRYHEGFMNYMLPDRKYRYCVCSESMIFDRMEMTVDDWRSSLMFTPVIADKEGAEWYRVVRRDNASEWRKAEGNGVALEEGERLDIYANMYEADYYDAYVCVTDNAMACIWIGYAGSHIDSFTLPHGVSCESLRIKRVEAPSGGIRISEQTFLNLKPCATSETGAVTLTPHYVHAEWRISDLDYRKPSQFDYVLDVSEKETIYVRDRRRRLKAK
jgi:hypothetical protein